MAKEIAAWLTYRGIRVPSQSTLDKYGLTVGAWKFILRRQGGGCGVCARQAADLPIPRTGSPPFLAIDHDHVKGWKLMKPELRREYVRGLCCTRCNHFVLTRFATPELHRLAADYLESYEARRA